jgi:hypothetical protein
MKTVIQFEMNGKQVTIPFEKIAQDKADYYKTSVEEEMQLFNEDSYEARDWCSNNWDLEKLIANSEIHDTQTGEHPLEDWMNADYHTSEIREE